LGDDFKLGIYVHTNLCFTVPRPLFPLNKAAKLFETNLNFMHWKLWIWPARGYYIRICLNIIKVQIVFNSAVT